MKIIYVTTAMEESDYNAFVTQWSVALNPTNQTFNLKLIKALAENNQVEVISIRPFSRTHCQIYYLDRALTKDKNINWHYLGIPRYKIFKYPACKAQTVDMLKTMDLKDTVVLTETINPIALHVANAIKDAYKLPIVGIVTDSPSNIKNTTKDFSRRIFKMSQRFDGYLALTSGLNTVFNPDNKPNLVFEGIVNDELPRQIANEFGNYIFFAGSLQDEYGVYSLIEAFKKIERKDLRLLICGFHADNKKLTKAIERDTRIVNLGIIANKKAIQLEMNALINIDPRPFSEDLDRFSIPSKTLEYMAMGRPVISVKNSALKEKFPQELIWLDGANESDLVHGMKEVLKMSEVEREELGRKAKNRVLQLYSLEALSNNIQSFLEQFVH